MSTEFSFGSIKALQPDSNFTCLVSRYANYAIENKCQRIVQFTAFGHLIGEGRRSRTVEVTKANPLRFSLHPTANFRERVTQTSDRATTAANCKRENNEANFDSIAILVRTAVGTVEVAL